MFKKLVCTLMVALFVFGLCSCNKVPEEVKVNMPDGKVAILLPPHDHYPEDYTVVKQLASEFPNNVVIYEYEDTRTLVAGNPDILTVAKKAAEDESISAMIFARAGYFTYQAVQVAKDINPNIVTVAIEPEQDLSKLNEIVDLTICADRTMFAKDLAKEAKNQKAKYFVYLTEPRFADENLLYLNFGLQLESACKENGITLIQQPVSDSLTVGRNIAVASINDAINELYDNGTIEGEDIVLYSLNPDMQNELVKIVSQKGLIYIAPQFPTAYSGISELYNVATPSDIKNVDEYVANVKTALQNCKNDKARFSIYAYSLSAKIQRGALYAVFDYLLTGEENGTIQDLAVSRLNNTEYSKDFTADYLVSEYKTVSCYAPRLKKVK